MKRLKNNISPVYNKYLDILVDDHQQKIRFYERYYKELKLLPDDAYFNLFIDYTKSLFKVREFRQFLKVVDRALELIIIENIESIAEEELYEEILYMKASALYYQLEHKQAEYVLTELINIQGVRKKSKRLFMKNSAEALKYNDQYVRSLIILLIIVSGITIGVELLLVRSFYPEHLTWIEQLRNAFFLAGILLFLLQEIRVRLVSVFSYKEISKNRKS